MKRTIALLGIFGFVTASYCWEKFLTENGYIYDLGMALEGPEAPNHFELLPRSPRKCKSIFINKLGKQAFPGKFDDAASFHEGLAAVKINGKWGFINKSGKMVIPAKFGYVENFSSGLAAVANVGHWQYLDQSGAVATTPHDCQWRMPPPFHGNIACIRLKGNGWQYWQVIDRTGANVIPAYPKRVFQVREGVVRVCNEDDKQGFISTSGKIIAKPQFDDACDFSEGLAAVCKNGKWGYIDKNAKTVIGYQFDRATCFCRGLAVVVIKGKSGLINKSGRLVLPAKYSNLLAMSDGLSPVSTSRFSEGLTPFMVRNRWGFADDAKGTTVILPTFNEVSPFSEGLARVGIADDVPVKSINLTMDHLSADEKKNLAETAKVEAQYAKEEAEDDARRAKEDAMNGDDSKDDSNQDDTDSSETSK